MKLVSFTVEKYRSITRAHKIRIDKIAILVGPNNEGKSNILRSLVAAMNVLTRGQRKMLRPNRPMAYFGPRDMYTWEMDFPIHLQSKEPNGYSSVLLEFELSDIENDEFKKEIRSFLNGTLPLRVCFKKDQPVIEVVKPGPGAKSLSTKSSDIAAFVARRIDFQHIPAVRTAASAQRIVDEMVERELRKLEDLPAYKTAIKGIEEIQRPILEDLSNSIKTTLSQFLPAIKDVHVQISEEARYKALRRSNEIIVDDGAPTLLEMKGDGVQSLAALGIMRHASEKGASGKQLIIAIEEPESHLHPKAIHELKSVISDLSQNHQLVLTTHCPLFVDRSRFTNNILVNNKKARPARNIQEVRDILGVKASDNLQHAELVLVVEGEDDRTVITSLLKHFSKNLKILIENNTIAIETLSGGTNLSYKIGILKDSLCNCHCFLDYDECGKTSYAKAKAEGLLDDADVNFCTVAGLKESEMEDLYEVATYESVIKNAYRVSLQSPKFKGNKKWSDRMHEVFKSQGKHWDDAVKEELKMRIAKVIAETPDRALNEHKKGPLENLIKALEERANEIKTVNA